MADFDQLIRDKANQAQYAYKPSAWRGFAKQAGLKAGLSGLQIAGITVGAVAVAGAITWGALSHSTQSVPTEPAQTPTEAVVVPIDTLSAESEESTSTPEPTAIPTSQPVRTAQPKPLEVKKDTAVAAPETSRTTTKQTPKKTTLQPYLRPVTISADTITQMVPTDEQIRKGNSRVL